MAEVILKNVTKQYDNGFVAVKSIDLEIPDKQFTVIVGPSGCGKTTTLRMIAGLEEISDGDIYIGEKLVNDISPKDRDIAMVFQNYALYPHMTVYNNMAVFAESSFYISHNSSRVPARPAYKNAVRCRQAFQGVRRSTMDRVNTERLKSLDVLFQVLEAGSLFLNSIHLQAGIEICRLNGYGPAAGTNVP